MILALLVLLPAPVIGWLAVRLLLGCARSAAELVAQIALGWGVGAGICALNYYLWLRFEPDSGAGFLAGEACLLGLLLGLLGFAVHLAKRHAKEPYAPSQIEPATRNAGARVLMLLLAGLLALSTLAAWRQWSSTLEASPHGSYDAWSVYNLKARHMYRGGDDWRHALSSVNPHPGYPLLLPALIARSWNLLGADLQVVPQLIAFIYMATTALLLVAALARHATPATGLLAGSLLLSTPFFSVHAASLFADGPLAWSILAVLVIVSRNERIESLPASWLLGGLIAALGAWTKNEGILFAGAAGAALFMVKHDATTRRRALGWFALGAAPLCIQLAHFKLTADPTATGLAPFSSEIVTRLLSPARYWVVVQAVALHSWVVAPALCIVFYAWTNGARRESWRRQTLLCCGAALALTLLGYLLAYVIASGDLAGMVSRSSRRLLLQVWPAALWTVFVCARPLFEMTTIRKTIVTGDAQLTPETSARSLPC